MKMKTWLKVLIGIFVLIGLITASSFYNSYFSMTSGKVIDENGKGISGVKVSIDYLCKNLINIEVSTFILSRKNTITNEKGEFVFDTYVGRPNIRSCEKFISVYKEGYCKDIRLCLNEIESGAGSEVDYGGLYFYKGKYYDPFYFMERTKIGSKINQVSFMLNKLP